MSEFIGARISLISKSDIRYVGTLIEINSEASTVSLDNVRSFGTEGRRGGKDEYPPSEAVYEQIVFRGSDVKDLRIEETPKDKPSMPQDPAIIGVQQSQRPDSAQTEQRPPQPPSFPPQGQFPPGPSGYPPPHFGQPPFPNRFGPGPQGGFPGGPGGPGPFPGGPGGFGMPPGPYGAPPGWFPPGQGFPNQPPGPFSPHMPIGPPGFQNQAQPPSGSKGVAPTGPSINKGEKLNAQPKVAEADGAAKVPEPKAALKPAGITPTPVAAKQPPPPPVDSKPDIAAALAPPAQPTQPASASRAPAGPKNNRIVPAVPLASPGISRTAPNTQSVQAQPGPTTSNATQQYQNATQAATAAVAAAMAKLDVAPGRAASQPNQPPMNANLQQRIDDMRDDQARRGGPERRGGRGRGSRGGHGAHHPKMEIPATDFDFASSNAKFNKMDAVKEAIASGSPLGENVPTPEVAETPTNGHANEESDVVIPPAAYNKQAGFFDNISSELKDREDAANNRGQEFRTQERRKNMETFGQGSVDGFRGGYRGRGRGRVRGRGFGYRGGRGGPRGRGTSQFGEQQAA